MTPHPVSLAGMRITDDVEEGIVNWLPIVINFKLFTQRKFRLGSRRLPKRQ